MSFVPPNIVSPSLLALATLQDDGTVGWTNAAWEQLVAHAHPLLAGSGTNQLALVRALASAGDVAASEIAAGVASLLDGTRDELEADYADAEHGGALALHAFRDGADRAVLICTSASVPDGEGQVTAGAWAWDLRRDTVVWSASLLDALGIAPREGPRDLEAALQLVEEAERGRVERATVVARSSGVFEEDLRIDVPDRPPRYLRLRGERVGNGATADRLAGFAYDISESRGAEHRLAELARFNEVVAKFGRVALENGDFSAFLTDVCDGAVEALRFCAVRIVEATADGDVATVATCGADDDAEPRLATQDDDAARAIVEQSPQRSHDLRGRWRSGVAVPLRESPFALQALSIEPDRFGDAELAFLQSVANLVAAAFARRQYEAQLIEARHELDVLLDNSPDLIMRFDRELRVIYLNRAAARLTDLSRAAFLGRRLSDVPDGSAAAAEEWEEGLSRVLASGVEQQFTTHGVVSQREFEVRCVPELTSDGTVRHLLAVCRDVTEARRELEQRRRLEVQLEQASRLSSLGRLSATVAHEFNNVLMAIQPFADLLQRRSAILNDSGVDRAATHIAQAVQRGRRITQEMLRYTRAVEPVRAPVAVNELLTYVCNSMRLVVAERMTIQLKLPDHELYLYADRAQLEQVFTNLVGNARDAVAVGGTLVISVDRPSPGDTFPFGVIPHVEQFLHLTFRDDGTGIPLDLMEHIFEPLFTSKRSGTGVGLAVAQQVVSNHGGYVFVESQQGVGTAFHLFLPAAEAASADDAVAITARRSVRLHRIALVEDEPSIAEGLSAVLLSEGFEVAHVALGAQATAMIESFRPEVLLLDVGLPDIDGLEVYERVHARWPQLPVIFSTGHADRRKVEEVAKQQHVGFLMKPYEVEELFAAIADVENRVAD
jgi:two-component system cell cycle sensor histidine kinase/response regulator CckA